MNSKIFKSLWGMTGSLESQFERIRLAGYDGVEGPLPAPEDAQRFRALLGEYGFDYIPRLQTTGPDHFDSLRSQVEVALPFRPLLINSHTGRDTMEESIIHHLFEKIMAFEQTLPVPISHETHRTRPTFTPWGTLRLVQEFPAIRITADFSHWCCVCESLLEDQQDTVQKIIRNVEHIHGRVGYKEGPQVPDPAAPEYANELAVHEAWWEQIILTRKDKLITFTPEYGPAFSRYLHTLPYTDQPVADIWAISLWTAERFRGQLNQLR